VRGVDHHAVLLVADRRLIMATVSTGGELIAGKYRVTRKLDSGGMADVFLARVEGAAGFARTVVIKRLAPALARDPEVVAMFLDEARIAARLHHGNIAQVFDFGTDAAGYYLAMEFLAGRDALDLVRAAAPDPLPLSAAVAIVVGAAAGLHHAHEQLDDAGRPLGIVHRDVTSSNVFVTADGGVKVIDFGIARAADRSTVTRSGLVKGTTAYLSPEQVAGVTVDRRSDLFQLGVVLYELVTGVRPFDRRGDTELVIMKRIEAGTFTRAREVRAELPADLDALIARMLAVDPAARLPTCESVIVELDALVRRYGWSTSPHELARVVKELFPVSPGGDAPDTLVDGGGGGANTPAETDRAAILEGLVGSPRQTAAVGGDGEGGGGGGGDGEGGGGGGGGGALRLRVASPRSAQDERDDAPETVRARTPKGAVPMPRPVIAARVGAPAAGAVTAPVRSRTVVVAAIATVAALGFLVFALWWTRWRETEAPAVVVTAADAAPTSMMDAAILDMSRTPGTPAENCLRTAVLVMTSLRNSLAVTPVRELRQVFESNTKLMPSMPDANDPCGAVASVPGYEDALLAQGGLEDQVRDLETAKRLTFAVMDHEANVATYRDLDTGRDLTTAEVDAR
jgi:serine/threonine protein kinase